MYESFYGLNAKPFQLSPDPRFFYGSKGHKRAAAYLDYGLSLGEGFIVITGEVGAGKTTLVRSMLKKLESENVVAAQLVSTQLDADDTLRMVGASFGLECEGISKSSLLKKIEGFLQAAQRQGKRALLLVDEAQNLTPRAVEELRMLSNFQSGDKPLLQSFLLGQPEFRKTLQSEDMQQLRQRVIASYHLGPMEALETRAYIEHRLKTAGWQGDPAFDDDAFDAIFTFTGGIPRRINTLCDRLLLFGFLEEKHRLAGHDVLEVISDLQLEVAGINEPQSAPKQAGRESASAGSAAPADISRLELKVEQVEKSVNRLLPLVRKILFLIDEKNQQRVE
jgi:putative secretion ATPase (PEP-CTERM system associated)